MESGKGSPMSEGLWLILGVVVALIIALIREVIRRRKA